MQCHLQTTDQTTHTSRTARTPLTQAAPCHTSSPASGAIPAPILMSWTCAPRLRRTDANFSEVSTCTGFAEGSRMPASAGLVTYRCRGSSNGAAAVGGVTGLAPVSLPAGAVGAPCASPSGLLANQRVPDSTGANACGWRRCRTSARSV